MTTTTSSPPLRALLVDAEAPTLAELAWLLGQDERIGEIYTCLLYTSRCV